jgi:DNA-binding transcriptional MerR regulator
MMKMRVMMSSQNTAVEIARVFIPGRIYFRIGDVAEILGVKPYVIRFWETEFPFVAPDKAVSGQRVYRRPQIEGLVLIKHLLHIERYSIEGAKKKLTELRRTAKLKEAMMELVKIEGVEEIQMKAPAENVQANHGSAPGMPVQIGSKVDKDSLSALTDSLTQSVKDLQALIREPGKHGLVVPTLPENFSKN